MLLGYTSSRAKCTRAPRDSKNYHAENNGDPSSGQRTSLGADGSPASSRKSSQIAVPSFTFQRYGLFSWVLRSSRAGSTGTKGCSGTEMSTSSWLSTFPMHRRWSLATSFFCRILLRVLGLICRATLPLAAQYSRRIKLM